MDLNQYDFIIIVPAQKFTENDEVIIKELHHLKKNILSCEIKDKGGC
jgi:hypothetical protein